jgi:hypothetical protein
LISVLQTNKQKQDKMKTTYGSRNTVTLGIAGCLAISLLGGICVFGQTSSTHKEVSASASTSLDVKTANGQSVVTLNGKQIYSGPTKGQVTSRSSNNNGVEYAAVYDGDRLLWENVPGAAEHLQPADSQAGPDHNAVMEQHQRTAERMQEEQRRFMEAHGAQNSAQNKGSVSQSGNVSVSTKTVNGSTVITYQGKQISVGPTKGTVSAKARSVNGKDYAAAFDGERVIWENVPGAAQQVK